MGRCRQRSEWRERRFRAVVGQAGELNLPIALVCTMCDNVDSFDSFACYYLGLGFCRIYCYIDDPHDAVRAAAALYSPERLKVRVRDEQLRREWSDLPSWTRLSVYVDTEVQARQQLNCEHALAQARSEGVRFLLHVDSDELLYVPFELPQKEGRDVQSASQAAVCQDPFPTAGPPWRSVLFEARAALRGHLAHLESLHALQFTYVNLEAVPEVEDSSDPFTSVTLFKTHPSQLKVTTMAARRALSHWTEAPASGGQFFRFYTNGKSLVRVDDEITTVASVHEWTLPNAQLERGYTNNPNLSRSPYVPHKKAKVDCNTNACILHYAVCSFSVFWRKRWAALGYASPNHRFRGVSGGLDQYANSLSIAHRRDEARALYARQLMLADPVEAQRQIEAGVCVRLTAARALIAACREEFLSSHLGQLAGGNRLHRFSCAPSGPIGAHLTQQARHCSTDSGHSEETPRLTLEDSIGCSLKDGRNTAGPESPLRNLPERCAVRAARAVSELRDRALREFGSDSHSRELAGYAIDVAESRAFDMARQAIGSDRRNGECNERSLSSGLTARDIVPPENEPDILAWLFELFISRIARQTLRLIPAPHLVFDLAGYWCHTQISRLVSVDVARVLLTAGFVVLPSILSSNMLSTAFAEAAMHLSRARELPDQANALCCSTFESHSSALWLHSPEAPPNAPPPCPARPVEDALVGPCSTLTEVDPMLTSLLRIMRGICAALELAAELRLALPRSALLEEHLSSSNEAKAPLNTGWPDTGIEVACTIAIAGRPKFRIRTREGHEYIEEVGVGCPVLILARSTWFNVELPQGCSCNMLNIFAYSSWQRTGNGLRVLGASEAIRKQLDQQ